MKTVSKSSFTLFELLIVILIISIIYGIFIERLGSKDRAVKEKGLEGVKEFLSSYDFNESAALKCVDECKRCFVYIDSKKVEEIPSFFQKRAQSLQLRYPRDALFGSLRSYLQRSKSPRCLFRVRSFSKWQWIELFGGV